MYFNTKLCSLHLTIFFLTLFLSLARSSPLFGFDCCFVRFRCRLCCFLAAQVPGSASCPLCLLKMPAHPGQGTSPYHAYLEARLCMCLVGRLKTALASRPPARQLAVLFILIHLPYLFVCAVCCREIKLSILFYSIIILEIINVRVVYFYSV